MLSLKVERIQLERLSKHLHKVDTQRYGQWETPLFLDQGESLQYSNQDKIERWHLFVMVAFPIVVHYQNDAPRGTELLR